MRHRAFPALAFLALTTTMSPSLRAQKGGEPRHPGAIESTGIPVEADTTVSPGDVLQVQWGGRWWAAQVVSLEPEGKVKVRYVGWEKRWEEVVPRARLQLDPEAKRKARGAAKRAGTPAAPGIAAPATAEIIDYYSGVDDETRRFIGSSTRSAARNGFWVPHSALESLTADQLTEKLDGWLRTLEGPRGRHQCLAIESLGAARCRDSVAPLLEIATATKRVDGRLRWLAVRALGRIGSEDAVYELIYLVDHYSPDTRNWARASLFRLTGKWFGDDREAWGTWWNESGRKPEYVPKKRYPTLAEVQAGTRGGRRRQGKRAWGPEQATGPPDTPKAADLQTAWASLRQDDGIEWLQLDYGRAVTIAEVRIRETYNPGAVTKVTALPDGKTEVLLWEGEDPSTEAPVDFAVPAQQEAVAKTVKVYLNTSRRSGWNEIDAVELLGKDGSRQWAVRATASSTYAEQGARQAELPMPTTVPAAVVDVDPPTYSLDVSSARTTVSVTFDRPMATERAWSWMILGAHGLYPGNRDAPPPEWDETRKTCTLPVTLVPGAVYAVGVNSPRHTGFRDASGVPALYRAWTFATGGFAAQELPPSVVNCAPAHGATDVDPALRTVSVTFDRPLRKHSWSWMRLAGCGEYPGAEGAEPQFDEAGLTCTLPVSLQPGKVYAVGVNSYRSTGFKGRNGAPVLPFSWSFRTRD